MSNKQILKSAFFKDFFRYYLAKFITGLVGILVIPGILRIYGETVYGEYSLSISIIQTVSTFFSAWLGRSFMRFYTRYEEKNYLHRRYNQLLYLSMIPVTLLIIAFLAGIQFHFSTIIIAVFCGSLFTFYSYSSLKSQTFLKSQAVLYAEVVRQLIFFSLVFVFYYLFKEETSTKMNLILTSNLWAFAIGNLLFTWLGSSPLKSKEKLIRNPEMDRKIREQLINYGLPLALWMIGAFILNISDRYILKIFYDFEIVGIYSSVYDTIFKLNTFLFMPLITTIQPRLIKHFNEGKPDLSKKILLRALLLEIGLLVIVFFFFLIARNFIIRDYLGFDSGEAIGLVFPILFGAFFWNLSTLLQKPLELAQRTKLMLFGILGTLFLNVVLNFIFIPEFGMLAAAYTSLISTFCYMIFVSLLSRNRM